MLPCDETLVLISAALDDTLTPEEQTALNAHLAHCPACSALYTELTELHTTVSELEDIPAPDGFADRVMAHIAADPTQDQVDNIVAFPTKKASRTAWKKWTATAAAVAVVVLGAVALPGQLGGMNKAVADHAVAYDTQAPAIAETIEAADGFFDSAAEAESDIACEKPAAMENQSTARTTNDGADIESSPEPLATPAVGNPSLDISNTGFEATYCGTLTLTDEALPDGLDEYEPQQDENGNLIYVVPAEYFYSLTDTFDYKMDTLETADSQAEYGLIIVKQPS